MPFGDPSLGKTFQNKCRSLSWRHPWEGGRGHTVVPICLGAYLELSKVTLTQHTHVWKIMAYSPSHLKKNEFWSWIICRCLKRTWVVAQMFQPDSVASPQANAQLYRGFHHRDSFLWLLKRFNISPSLFNGCSWYSVSGPFAHALCPFIC